MTRHWVLIETGGNQAYVFGSNRLRHVIGASQLVLMSCTDWVKAAVASAGLPETTIVQSTSGKALLLVDDRAAGQAVIRSVNYQALASAPGLEVTGVVGPGFDESLTFQVSSRNGASVGSAEDHAWALRQTYLDHGRVRNERPSQVLRDQLLPWHEVCRETGLPAAGSELYGTDPRDRDAYHPASAAVMARTKAQEAAKQRLADFLGTWRDTVPKNLDELANDGWVAVVHADGNGIGRLFQDFPVIVAAAEGSDDLSLETHCRYLKAFAAELESATQAAFREAIAESLDGLDIKQWKGTLLPVVIGGDDVTFLCHARFALPVVTAFLRRFEVHTAASTKIRTLVAAELARRSGDRGIASAGATMGLTAAAGIAVVKPHHPFSVAYELAEALTHSAKEAKTRVRDVPLSSFDFHIAHESTLRPLHDTRAGIALRDPAGVVARHAGPYLLVNQESDLAAGLEPEQQAWLEAHSADHLNDLLAGLSDGWLSSARAHELRGALDRGTSEYAQARKLALRRARDERDRDPEDAPPAHDDALLDVVEVPPERFVRLVDAMLLDGAGLNAVGGAR